MRSEAVATNVVVSAASLATVLLLHTAARRWTTNPHAPRLAVAVLLLSPASIFLWLYYSEGLFLALSIAALLTADRDRHLTAGLLGAGVAATRTIGILIALPLLLAAWHHPDRRRRLYAAVPFAGLAAVMAAQHLQAGNALAFRHTSTLWGCTTTLPWQTLIDRVHLTIVGGHFGVTFVADLGTVVVCVALAWHARRSTIPRHVQLWGALMIATPLCSGLLFSWSRYMLAAWPAAIALGQLLTTRPRTTRVLLTVAAGIVAAQRVHAWHHGFFVG